MVEVFSWSALIPREIEDTFHIKHVASDPPSNSLAAPRMHLFLSARKRARARNREMRIFHQPFARHHLPLRENISSFCAGRSAAVLLFLHLLLHFSGP